MTTLDVGGPWAHGGVMSDSCDVGIGCIGERCSSISHVAHLRSQVGGVAVWSAIRGGSEFRHPLETHLQAGGSVGWTQVSFKYLKLEM